MDMTPVLDPRYYRPGNIPAAEIAQTFPLAPLGLIERFCKSFAYSPVGCWRWRTHKGHKGYGIFCIGRKQYRAHRVAYEWAKGSIPATLVIDHLCSDKMCVNPLHLEAVTNEENLRRAVERRECSEVAADRRSREAHARNLYETTRLSRTEIAKITGLGGHAIERICRGLTRPAPPERPENPNSHKKKALVCQQGHKRTKRAPCYRCKFEEKPYPPEFEHVIAKHGLGPAWHLWSRITVSSEHWLCSDPERQISVARLAPRSLILGPGKAGVAYRTIQACGVANCLRPGHFSREEWEPRAPNEGRKPCTHGIVPKRACDECRKAYGRAYSRDYYWSVTRQDGRPRRPYKRRQAQKRPEMALAAQTSRD